MGETRNSGQIEKRQRILRNKFNEKKLFRLGGGPTWKIHHSRKPVETLFMMSFRGKLTLTISDLVVIHSIRFMPDELVWAESVVRCLKILLFYPQESLKSLIASGGVRR